MKAGPRAIYRSEPWATLNSECHARKNLSTRARLLQAVQNVMKRRIQHQNAYLLHSRPYSESSLLIDTFSRNYGRVSLVAKGVRRSKSKIRGILRPFQPLLLSWSGKGELHTLTGAETPGSIRVLAQSAWLCGCYMNELLVRLLHKYDPHEKLFDDYSDTLLALEQGKSPQIALRLFEKRLLKEIGYGLVLTHDVKNNHPVIKDRIYRYFPDSGPTLIRDREQESAWIVSGATLIALENEKFSDSRQLTQSKHLLRALLNQSLQGRQLKSRSILQTLNEIS